MEPQKVDPATVNVWRCEAVFTVLALSLPALLVALVGLPGPVLVAMVPAASIAIVVAMVIAWVLPSAQYQAFDYEVDEAGISIRSGIVWRSQIRLPRVRIQHTDVSQGPLQRRFGVATLKLYTAGSRYTRIDLPGLAHDEALALRDALIARTGAGSGV
jgi:membrane protein YdbS with pleckstrin-like domain